MKIVSNSSVLIALGAIGQLELIPQRFPGGILIPDAVWNEVVETGRGLSGSEEVEAASWITKRSIADRHLFLLLSAELDYGESEAIALCAEENADMILLDEKAARQKARRMGLTVLGTVGILIWAKRNGHTDSLREQLEKLMTKGNFRLSRAVCDQALQSVGEIHHRSDRDCPNQD